MKITGGSRAGKLQEEITRLAHELTSERMAEHIYGIISTQDFTNWFNGEFEDHIQGEEGCASLGEVLKDIKRVFLNFN